VRKKLPFDYEKKASGATCCEGRARDVTDGNRAALEFFKGVDRGGRKSKDSTRKGKTRSGEMLDDADSARPKASVDVKQLQITSSGILISS